MDNEPACDFTMSRTTSLRSHPVRTAVSSSLDMRSLLYTKYCNASSNRSTEQFQHRHIARLNLITLPYPKCVRQHGFLVAELVEVVIPVTLVLVTQRRVSRIENVSIASKEPGELLCVPWRIEAVQSSAT